MNTLIPCHFAESKKVPCAIQHRDPLQAGGIAPRWKPFLRRTWPTDNPAAVRNRALLQLDKSGRKTNKSDV